MQDEILNNLTMWIKVTATDRNSLSTLNLYDIKDNTYTIKSGSVLWFLRNEKPIGFGVDDSYFNVKHIDIENYIKYDTTELNKFLRNFFITSLTEESKSNIEKSCFEVV